MYEVYLEDKLAYYPGDEYAVLLDGVVKQSLNECDVFEFTVPFFNPGYDNAELRKSMVKVKKNGIEIFYGEVREIDKDMNNSKQIYAVGELAFLFDSIQPQAEYHDLSPRQMLETWLNEHNAQVGEKKKFYCGIVTVHDSNDSIFRYTNQETTLDCIRDKLCNKLNGYLRIRKVNGRRYLDLVTLQDYGKICEQPVQFGENLLEYAENLSGTDIATACLPRGGRLEESPVEGLEAYTDIKSVNNGKDYVTIPAAIEKYDMVKRVVNWDDVYVPSILKSKAENWLKDAQYANVTLNVTAVDMSILDGEMDAWELGDSIHAVADPYGMDRYFPVGAREFHLLEPEKDRMQLGTTIKKDIIRQNQSTKSEMQSNIDNVRQTTSFLQSAIDNATQMLTGSKGGYKVTEFDKDGLFLRDLYMNAPTKEAATQVMQIGPQGIGFSRTGFNGPYKSAWTIDGQLLGEWIAAGSVKTEALSVEYRMSVQKEIEDAETGAKEYAQSQITTAIKAMQDSITLSVSEERKYTNGVKSALEGQIKVASDSVTTEVNRATAAEGKLAASIKVNADGIKSTVAKNDFEGYLKQYYNAVIFQFNYFSDYVQISPGSIDFYNGIISNNQLRASIDCNGSHFYANGKQIGIIGPTQMDGYTDRKGISFNLDYWGYYMLWAAQPGWDVGTYDIKWMYVQKKAGWGNYASDMLHAGCDIDMHYHTLRNVNFEKAGITDTFSGYYAENVVGNTVYWSGFSLTFDNGRLIKSSW